MMHETSIKCLGRLYLKTTDGCFDAGSMLNSALIMPKFHTSLAFNMLAEFWLRHFFTDLIRARFLRFILHFGFTSPCKFHIRQNFSFAVTFVSYSKYQCKYNV